MYHIECWTMLDLKNSMMALILLRNPMNPELPVMAEFGGLDLWSLDGVWTYDLWMWRNCGSVKNIIDPPNWMCDNVWYSNKITRPAAFVVPWPHAIPTFHRQKMGSSPCSQGLPEGVPLIVPTSLFGDGGEGNWFMWRQKKTCQKTRNGILITSNN